MIKKVNPNLGEKGPTNEGSRQLIETRDRGHEGYYMRGPVHERRYGADGVDEIRTQQGRQRDTPDARVLPVANLTCVCMYITWPEDRESGRSGGGDPSCENDPGPKAWQSLGLLYVAETVVLP